MDYCKEQVIVVTLEQAEHRHRALQAHLQALPDLPDLRDIPEVLPERSREALRDEECGVGTELTDIPVIPAIRGTDKEVLCRFKHNIFPRWGEII